MRNLALLVILIALQLGHTQTIKKVLLIGIDGCRSDALETANTPNIDALISDGLYSPDALNDDITISGPGWSAILCGTRSPKHLVTGNDFSGNNYAEYPSMVHYIEGINSDYHTVSICHWGPINDNIIGDAADFKLNVSTDEEVANQAAAYLEVNDPDLLFLHFDDPDAAGHGSGFTPNNPNYISTIEGVDNHIGIVIDALMQRPTYSEEDWLILLTTDHGGINTSHGGNTFEERRVFFIASSPAIPTEVILRDSTVTAPPTNCLGTAEELIFLGNNEYVQIPASSTLDFGTEQDFTIECRIKTDVAADVAIIGNKDWDSGANAGFVFSFKFASGPEWKVNIGDGSNRADINTGGFIADGQWHTLSVTFDRDGLMTMYEDGNAIDSIDISTIGDITTGQGLFFGTDFLQAYDYRGAIAEVRAWNGILPASSIADWHCTVLDNTHTEYNQLIGYWPLNEGSGATTALDQSGNGLDGNIQGATWQLNDSLVVYNFEQTPRLVDVFPTVFHHLCLPIEPAWDLDGQAWIPLCIPVNTEDLALEESWLILPNPNQGKFTLERKSTSVTTVKITLLDAAGRTVFQQKNARANPSFDVSYLQTGVYLLKIEEQDGSISAHQIVIE